MQPADLARPPGVLVWYRVYCGIICALSFLDVLAGLALLLFLAYGGPGDVPSAGPGTPAEAYLALLRKFGPLLAALSIGGGLLMTALFGLTFFLPRNPWAWMYHLALIGLGLPDCLLFLPCLFLMIFWLKPDNRTYFGCDRWMS
jgi:hypothetical protein